MTARQFTLFDPPPGPEDSDSKAPVLRLVRAALRAPSPEVRFEAPGAN
jgi:hypothetical protein